MQLSIFNHTDLRIGYVNFFIKIKNLIFAVRNNLAYNHVV